MSLRLPSVIAASLCIPLAGAIARAIAGMGRGRAAGLTAAILVATSPVHIGAAQDARTYAMLALAVLVMLAAILRATDRPHDAAPYAAFAAAGAAAVLLHNTAILIVAALDAAFLADWFFASETRRKLRPFLLANLAIAAAFALWMPIVVWQFIHTLAHFWLAVPTLRALRFALLNSVGQPFVHIAQPLPDLLFVTAGLAGLWFYRRRTPLIPIAACLLILLPGTTWLISQFRPIMNGKTLEFLAPVFLIFAALGITRIRRLAFPATAALAAIQLAGCVTFFNTRSDEAFPQVAATLRTQTRPGDTLYTDPLSNQILLTYYGFSFDSLRTFAPQGADPWCRLPNTITVAPENVSSELGHSPRLWILTRTGAPAHAALRTALSATLKETFTETFGTGRMRNLRLSLFEAREGGKD